MNILLVNRWYPPYTGFGGVAAYNYYLAHALAKKNNNVIVLASMWDKHTPFIQIDRDVIVYRIPGISLSKLNNIPKIGKYSREIGQYLYSQRVSSKIKEINRTHKFDIVEFAEINAEGYSYLHEKNHRPIITRCHTPTFVLKKYYFTNEIGYDTRLTEKMEKFCIQNANLVTTPSYDMARVINEEIPQLNGNIEVIPNPLDLQIFKPAENQSDQTKIKILHVGRMERVKGIEVLVDAIPTVLQRIPVAQFIFVGDNSNQYSENLQNKIYGNNLLKDHVIFMGSLNQEELIRAYQTANIAVVPTLNYESFSYTCAQAMACGLPLIASKIGGIPETVGTGGAAFLIEPGNSLELSNSIIKLCESLSLRRNMGKLGRRQAEEKFSDDLVATKTLCLYSSVIN